ncbi:Uncharacterised protein [Vibrio cholerae]|nr:Uncharacterised protein [Vibrio cholerae]
MKANSRNRTACGSNTDGHIINHSNLSRVRILNAHSGTGPKHGCKD